MPDVTLPYEVENFIRRTGEFLEDFQVNLTLDDENSSLQSRRYTAHVADGPVEVLVKRSLPMSEEMEPSYRIHVTAPLWKEFIEHIESKPELVNILNKGATLGALSRNGATVSCQCRISQENTDTLAGLLAAAIVHARSSLTESAYRTATKQSRPTVESLSAWTDIDFEAFHYDYAHLGIIRHYPGEIKVTPSLDTSLTMTAIHTNPYWGGGLLCLYRSRREAISEDSSLDASDLNTWNNALGTSPTLGAWCADGDDLVFVQFFPNFVKPLPNLMDLILYWTWARHEDAKAANDLHSRFGRIDL